MIKDEESKTPNGLNFVFRLAGGISTLESGFAIGFLDPEDESCPISCLLANKEGEIFAKFHKDKTVQKAKDCTRAELEAIEGVKSLILRWQDK